MKTNGISIKILKELSHEGKKKDTEISRDIGVPTSTIHKKRGELMENGLLKIYGVPQYKKLGMVELIFGIDVSHGENERVAKALSGMKEVTKVSHTMGDHSLVAEAVVGDLDSAKNLSIKIAGIPNVVSTHLSIVVSKTKEDFGSPLY